MNKRFFALCGAFCIMGILSSCTLSGLECGLLGRWECDGYIYEFKSDDTLVISSNGNERTGHIDGASADSSVSGSKCFKVEFFDEDIIHYDYELVFDTLTLTDVYGDKIVLTRVRL